jgi:hypothetical protein
LELLPKDISESIVTHLRLGNVFAGHQLHEKEKRPLSIDYLKILLKTNIRKKQIIGKCHFGCPSQSSTNNERMYEFIKYILEAGYFDFGDVQRVCVFYYRRTYYKAVRVGGGGEWRTCAMRDDEPRPVGQRAFLFQRHPRNRQRFTLRCEFTSTLFN